MAFKEIKAQDLSINPFNAIGKEWMLISAEKDGKTNTLTASWGGLGVLWSKNVAFIFIRNSRYTKEFIDNADTFSITMFDHEKYASMLGYMGKISGRTEDKIAKQGLTILHDDKTPYFEQGKLVLICKKIHAQPVLPENFIDPKIDSTFYADKDYHVLYVGEISKVLEQ